MKRDIKEKGQIIIINKGESAAETLMQMLFYFCDTLPSSNFSDVQQHVGEGAANTQLWNLRVPQWVGTGSHWFKATLAASSKTHVSLWQALWVMEAWQWFTVVIYS